MDGRPEQEIDRAAAEVCSTPRMPHGDLTVALPRSVPRLLCTPAMKERRRRQPPRRRGTTAATDSETGVKIRQEERRRVRGGRAGEWGNEAATVVAGTHLYQSTSGVSPPCRPRAL
jgi:hypothetical protein